MKLRHKVVAVLPAVLLLTSCSEGPKPAEKAKEPPKPAEPVTALTAVYRMFTQARAWSPDCKLLRAASLDLKEVKAEPGKAGAWEATFVSEANQRARRYTYSVIEASGSNLHEGVSGGPMDSWSPGGQAKPFLIQAFKTDSPAAYQEALGNPKAKEYSGQHPEIPVKFLIEQTSRFPDPAWRLYWGESLSTSGFSVFVDAMTGKFLQTSR